MKHKNTTALLKRLNISLPIFQAPMAGVQGSALAIAVSEAGGLGGLPTAMSTLDGIRNEVAAIRARTKRPFNINFFCHREPPLDEQMESAWRKMLRPYYDEWGIDPNLPPSGLPRAPFDERAAELLEEIRPPVVSFHLGLPRADLLQRVRDTNAILISSATTVEEAVWLEKRGVDIIVAQGLEAGGHRGMFLTSDLSTQMGIVALLPQIVGAVNVPVVAAGGIADARGVAAALALGASAVQVGTAYLLCHETTTSPIHRAALKSESSRHTALTNLFSGRPARSIVNRLMTDLGPMNPSVPTFPLAAGALASLRAAAESKGCADFSPLWSGQNASGCREVGAGEMTLALGAGYCPTEPA